MKGYAGKILRVDLSQGRVEMQALEEGLAKTIRWYRELLGT